MCFNIWEKLYNDFSPLMLESTKDTMELWRDNFTPDCGQIPTELHQGQVCLKFCSDQQKHICLL